MVVSTTIHGYLFDVAAGGLVVGIAAVLWARKRSTEHVFAAAVALALFGVLTGFLATFVYADDPSEQDTGEQIVDIDSTFDLDANIDYIGPDHPPPSSVSSSDPKAHRYWLTW